LNAHLRLRLLISAICIDTALAAVAVTARGSIAAVSISLALLETIGLALILVGKRPLGFRLVLIGSVIDLLSLPFTLLVHLNQIAGWLGLSYCVDLAILAIAVVALRDGRIVNSSE
jgi:hypothetical protein